MGVGADDAVLSEPLDQRVFKLVRNQITAFSQLAHLQSIAEFGAHAALAAELVPESLLIGIGSAASLRIQLLCGGGLLGQRGAGGHGHLAVHGFQPLQTADLIAQGSDLILHVGIGGIILCGEETVSIAVGIQESLCRFPGLGALVAQFSDSHTDHPPVSFSKEKAVPSVR